MFSKVLIKLIDRAIVPAVLLFAARIVSLVLISKYLGLSFQITRDGFMFEGAENYVKVNSYSILSMVGVLLIGVFYVIAKSFFFHNSHIKPSLTAKLYSLKVKSLIQDSFDLYTQGVVWMSYSYLLLIVSGIMALSKLLYEWVFFVTLGFTVLTTIILITDVDEEIKIKKDSGEQYDADKSFIEDLSTEGELE